MKQEEKQLLLADLCARLPYGVKCQFEDTIRLIDGEGESFYDYTLSARHLDLFINHKNFYIKPYLRPMSEIANLISAKGFTQLSGIELIDWYNANHIDYRNLIEHGLALEAPKDMYNLENK